ncbi:MAG: hypothetical protein ACK4NF_00240 [Planctomycetota bacterium]
MSKKVILKSILTSLQELSRAFDEIRHSIRTLDFKKLPQLLKKESRIIEKLEKYAESVKNEQRGNDKNNMRKVSNILPFPQIPNEKESDELLAIRHLYGELIRKVFIIGNLVEQHLNLYRMVYGRLSSSKNASPGVFFLDKKM